MTNIRPHLQEDISPELFKQTIIDKIMELNEDCELYEYSEEDILNIQRLADEIYATQAWNFGNSPNFSYRHAFRYEKGASEICVNANRGVISDVCFYGDFFGRNPDLSILTSAITGAEYSREGISKAIEGLNVSDFIADIDNDLFVSGFFAAERE